MSHPLSDTIANLAKCCLCGERFIGIESIYDHPDGQVCPNHEIVPCWLCGSPGPEGFGCDCEDDGRPAGIADTWEEQRS